MSRALLVALSALLALLVAAPAASAAAAEPPRCFGAADRDPRNPCSNPALKLQIKPTPAQARRAPQAPCRDAGTLAGAAKCTFGVAASKATGTTALIGDSHASHWRAAVDVLARAKGWHAHMIRHSSCPLSTATRDIAEPTRSSCARWKPAVFEWLEDRPEIETVFMSQLAGGSGVVPTRGRSEFETSVAGYAGAFKKMPASVKRIVVIRDTPKMDRGRDACLRRAVARKRSPGPACAVRRPSVLDPDPAYTAARRSSSARVHALDFTPFMCTPRTCLPVVGGVLVNKDATHITVAFIKTLGPYLLREFDRVTGADV